MKKAPKLCFALLNDQWVSIKSVKKGLACNCHCPVCGARLIARKGVKQQQHFAHYHHAKCPGGLETALHLFGKQLLLSARKLMGPAIHTFKGSQLQAASMRRFDKAEQEVGFNGLVLDVLLKNTYEQLAVELKVTHGSGNFKQYQLIKHGLECIEIDLLAIYQNLWSLGIGGDMEAFKEAILYQDGHRKWLFNSRQHKWEYWAQKQATPRKVIHTRQGSYHHYHVFRCPENKRFVRGGFRDGQSYARVFQDCMHCAFCREIVYEKKWVAYKQLNTRPIQILCQERENQ